MHFSFNLLRIKGLYMFRSLLAHPQEPLHKRHLVYCMLIMSVGCATIADSLQSWHKVAHVGFIRLALIEVTILLDSQGSEYEQSKKKVVTCTFSVLFSLLQIRLRTLRQSQFASSLLFFTLHYSLLITFCLQITLK
jgi:hypothetical protein